MRKNEFENLKELSSQEIKSVCFEILCKIDKFCKENGIKYFIHAGTLLGAVRHKGFIPWDDDIDIAMPRPEFQRFCKIFKNDDDLFLATYKNVKKMAVPFAKVCSKKVLCFRGACKVDYSLGVDVFPLDGFPKTEIEQKKYFDKQLFIFFKIWKRFFSSEEMAETNPNYNKTKKFVRRFFNLFFKSKNAAKLVEKNAMKNKYDECEFAGCSVGIFRKKMEIVPKSSFEKSIELQFENRKFPAPEGYGAVLSSIFGDDYMTPPPVTQQSSTHIDKYYWK